MAKADSDRLATESKITQADKPCLLALKALIEARLAVLGDDKEPVVEASSSKGKSVDRGQSVIEASSKGKSVDIDLTVESSPSKGKSVDRQLAVEIPKEKSPVIESSSNEKVADKETIIETSSGEKSFERGTDATITKYTSNTNSGDTVADDNGEMLLK